MLIFINIHKKCRHYRWCVASVVRSLGGDARSGAAKLRWCAAPVVVLSLGGDVRSGAVQLWLRESIRALIK